MAIANANIAQLFTIPEDTWEEINNRVQFILKLDKMDATDGSAGRFEIPWPNATTKADLYNLSGQDYQKPNTLTFEVSTSKNGGQINWVIDTGNQDILPLCQAWQNTTFDAIINHAENVATYATNALDAFQNWNPDNYSTSSLAAEVNKLATNAKQLHTEAKTIFKELQQFLKANQAFENFLQTNNFLIPLLNIPQVQAQSFALFDIAIEKVLGAWGAIQNDLGSGNVTPQQVTNSFIQSLNIQVSKALWKKILDETNAFTISQRPPIAYDNFW